MACSCNGCCNENPAPVKPVSPATVSSRWAVRILVARFVVASVLFVVALVLPFLGGSLIVMRLLFLLSWLVAGYKVVLNAFQNILRGDVFDENFLMSVATIGAFLIGQWSEGAAVMLFYNLGEMIQESAVTRSRKSITDLMDVRPDVARLAAGNEEVHPSAVSAHSLISVKPGEKVPLDGIIVEGFSSFDTSRLTGESVPRDVSPGDEALAGFVNGGGLLIIRTTVVYAETAASKMLDLIENAQQRKAKAEKLIRSFARVYTPIVTIGALLIALIPPFVLFLLDGQSVVLWSSFQTWISRGLVFLVISCPCAFVISVPLGFFGGIGGAAKLGILVKGADFIDVLAKTKAVVFDKTGTLTSGVFRVQTIEVAGEYTERYVATLAAYAEFHSNHPVGMAIRSYASENGIEVESGSIRDYTERAGFGVSLSFNGKSLLAGSRKFMKESGVSGIFSAIDNSLTGKSGTSVEIAFDGIYIGRLILNDEAKADSAEAIKKLKGLGIHDIVMLTGDTESAATDIASKIGITDVRFGVLPHQKVSFFEEVLVRVKAQNPKATVLFVGDGINDAPVLARADAGLAMGGIGSDAAIEAADVVLMNDNPLLVAEAIRSARWTRRIVMENIVLSFGIKIGFLFFGAIGIATLWEAVFADVGVALLATVNSLRARNLPRRFTGK